MPLTINQLQSLLDGQNLKYFVDPRQPTVLLDVRGTHGTYRFLISIQVDGQFLQVRSVDYLRCASEHPHLAEVLKVLARLNYGTRFVKFGWDPSDGEIVAYADVWIMDGTMTESQFTRILHNYVPTVDSDYARIKAAAETGTDPGEEPNEPGYSTI